MSRQELRHNNTPPNWLSGLVEILPLTFDGLQLMHSAFFGIEVIFAVRHAAGTLQLYGTLGPFRRPGTLALWTLIFNNPYAVAAGLVN